MKKFAIPAVIIASLSLTACLGGPSSTGGVKKAETRTGFMGLTEKDALSVTTADAFKGAKDVVIGSFIVGFDLQKSDSQKAGGGLLGNGFGGKSTAKSKLVGVNDADFQKISDAAYTDFLAKLKAKGYNVIDRAELLNHADFKDTKSYANPYLDEAGGILTNATAVKYFAPSSFGKEMKIFGGDVPGLTGGFAFGNANLGASNYAEKTGKKVLHVVYRVDYANTTGHGGWAASSSSVEIGQGITVVPEASRIGIIGGQAGTFSSAIGNIQLGQPVSSDKAFADVKSTSSDAHKTTEAIVNVIGVLGGIGSNSSREYEFDARPADFEAATLEAVNKTSDAFVGKMGSLK